MTPREVEELTPTELQAFWQYAEEDARAQERAARRAARGR
jgi:hypothetical protein